MKKGKKRLVRTGLALGLSAALFAGGMAPAFAQEAPDAFAQKLEGMYDEIEIEYRPDVRWWLAEGLNTDETLKKNIQELYDSGFGAAEFLAMPEPGADSSIYGWGSEEWTNDTRLIIQEATEKGMGFSLTSGTHWANANLPDTYIYDGEPYNPDNKAASKELNYSTVYLAPGEQFSQALPHPVAIHSDEDDAWGTSASFTKQEFQGVVAAKLVEPRARAGQAFGYAEGEGTGVLDLHSVIDLTGQVREENGEYSLDWTAPEDGEYALLTYWMHGTSQTATPSVNTNYTINYMDAYGIDALIQYWEDVVLTDELKETIRQNGRGEIYMDSLELSTFGAGGIFWGYHLKEEFLNRKGYDITPYLPFITQVSASTWTFDYDVQSEEDKALIEKVRTDFNSVISDMYCENVLQPLQTWLHSLNMKLRAEPSYSSVYFEISTPAKYIDGVETESYAQNADIDLYRGMLGSANMYGRLFSSETGAVHGHNYVFDMDTWTQLCYIQFAEGINRTVFHGYSAIEGSEEDTYWPGHEGMYAGYSERFNSRQPASQFYKDWTEMLARNQKVLRQGTAARDIAILRTDYNYLHYGFPEGYDDFTNSYTLNDRPYFFQDLSLQNAGYTYDYFSPLLLLDEDNVTWNAQALQPDGPAYKALVLYQETLELDAARKILQIAQSGLPVIFVNNTREMISHRVDEVQHGQAASRSMSLNETEAQLEEVVDQIKALANVAEVDGAENVLGALEGLGVTPRVAYEDPDNKLLTISRSDRENDIFYTYAYSFKFTDKDAGPSAFTLAIEGEGAPYRIDDWTGEVTKLGAYRIENGRTLVELTLVPGQSAIIALDKGAGKEVHALSATAGQVVLNREGLALKATQAGDYELVLSDGQTARVTASVPEGIALTQWDITVEDWNEGDKVVNIEEKFGHETREVYYTTNKTQLTFAASPLMPWKDLPATQEQLAALGYEGADMSHVSGIGTYETRFTLPEDWSEMNGAYLTMESANGGLVQVYVNGQKASGVNTRTLTVDIGDLLVAGENRIRIQVSSTLTNRMLQKEYINRGGEGWMGSNWTEDFPTVQDYGLVGDVTIVPYTLCQVG